MLSPLVGHELVLHLALSRHWKEGEGERIKFTHIHTEEEFSLH